jgi:outer membrane lipoprotein-sorting protein
MEGTKEVVMSVMASRPVMRWVVPAGVVLAVLGGGALTTVLRASAGASLPPRSAAQLLVDLQTARLDGVSGTVVERADLGLPRLPGTIGGDGSSQLNSLITGSHTLRVWYSGTDKARIALLGALGESDIVYNGTDAWIWSSATNSATHFKRDATQVKPDRPETLPSDLPKTLPSDLPKTPQEAADRVLALISPTTSVTTEGTAVVAGHPAYELVLQPKDSNSLVAQVRIAIDGTQHVPTRVEVFAKGLDNPAFEIGFTQVSFKRPDDGVFKFTPPPGAKITEGDKDTPGAKPEAPTTRPKTAVIGTGWTAVLVARPPADSIPGASIPGAPIPGAKGGNDRGQPNLDAFLAMLPQVHGSFGTGRVLQSRLFSVLLLDDGRVLIGAVKPERLIAAAADPAAALK